VSKKKLVDDVVQRVESRRGGNRTWFEKLPEDLQAELREVRVYFLSTCRKKRPFAVAIAEAVAERGFEKPGEQAVVAWLNRAD